MDVVVVVTSDIVITKSVVFVVGFVVAVVVATVIVFDVKTALSKCTLI